MKMHKSVILLGSSLGLCWQVMSTYRLFLWLSQNLVNFLYRCIYWHDVMHNYTRYGAHSAVQVGCVWIPALPHNVCWLYDDIHILCNLKGQFTQKLQYRFNWSTCAYVSSPFFFGTKQDPKLNLQCKNLLMWKNSSCKHALTFFMFSCQVHWSHWE